MEQRSSKWHAEGHKGICHRKPSDIGTYGPFVLQRKHFQGVFPFLGKPERKIARGILICYSYRLMRINRVFCHHVLTLLSFHNCMTFFFSVEHKGRYPEECWEPNCFFFFFLKTFLKILDQKVNFHKSIVVKITFYSIHIHSVFFLIVTYSIVYFIACCISTMA